MTRATLIALAIDPLHHSSALPATMLANALWPEPQLFNDNYVEQLRTELIKQGFQTKVRNEVKSPAV